jgi:hypothetical protein
MRKLTKGRVGEDLVHELVVSPVAREGKGPSRYVLELLRRILFVMPLRWLQLPLYENKCIRTNAAALARDATHLGGIHATTAVALATTLERFHFTILLREHRLRVWPPADPDAHAYPRTYVRWHAANGTRGRYALPLPLAHNEDGWLVMLAQRVLSNWLGLQRGRDG